MREIVTIKKPDNTPESIRKARAELAQKGFTKWEADQYIFHALGGGDLIGKGKDGKPCYKPSGKPVGFINWPPEDSEAE